MRCPYCKTDNDEAAEFCRSCGQELPQDQAPWRGPQTTSAPATPADVARAHKEWDPATRFAEPKPTSAFVPPARFPNHLGWAIAALILCFLLPVVFSLLAWGWIIAVVMLALSSTGFAALYCSLRVKPKHALGDDDRAFRYSQLAKFWCWVSYLIGFAFYVGLFMLLMWNIGKFWGY
jgi:hypothetical protein